MSIRFSIKNLAGAPEKEGNVTIRYTGSVEPFRRGDERQAREIGQDSKGDPVIVFNTGLDENKVQFLKWYNEEEKEVLRKQIKDLKPIISEFYGGDDVISDKNKFFWKTPEVNKLVVTNETTDIFLDTKDVRSALLYLSICSGAFDSLVAPTKEWAEKNQMYHYLVLESEDVIEDDEDVTKSDAHAALGKLREEEGSDALFILAWCMQYDTSAYGAYLMSTPVRDLVAYHVKFINGNLASKKKKKFAKVFLDYFKKWQGTKTRPSLYTEAYVNAGDYFNFLTKKDKSYYVGDVELGKSLKEVTENLAKTKYAEQYETLRSQVEAKWKE